MQGTVRLHKAIATEPPQPKEPPVPLFDENAHYGEVGGMEGVRYVQGPYLFNNRKVFVREAPESVKLAPLTPKQEADRRARMQANKKFFAHSKVQKNGEIPANVRNAERENARARAAESYGE